MRTDSVAKLMVGAAAGIIDFQIAGHVDGEVMST